MAVHTLVTGTPGAGKTLYMLSELASPFVGATFDIEVAGVVVQAERRLVVGNVRELLLPHELMHVPEVNPESFTEPHPKLERDPGQPALDVPCDITSWWLWCKPGDVIIVDECQRAFRPVASGRRVPQFIAKLETARHYGVEFIFVTQHPQLLHINVRNLVGRHLHVRRLFAGMQTIVYEWDHCTHPDRVKNASAKPWRHKRKAYGLYKSAEVHTKGKAAIPGPLIIFVVALLALPFAVWYAKGRIFNKPPPEAPAQHQSADSGLHAAVAHSAAAVFRAPVGTPAFPNAIIPRRTWPEAVAGCWLEGDDCRCVTQESPPRIVSDRPAMCLAVVAGDLVPPESHPRPERVDVPSYSASAPAAGST